MTIISNQLRYQSANARSVFFVDPTNPRDSLRVGASVKNKRLGTESIPNVNADLTQLRRRPVKSKCGTCSSVDEVSSIRVEFSGAIDNAEQLQKDWQDFKANVDLAIQQGLLHSLKPALDAAFILKTETDAQA